MLLGQFHLVLQEQKFLSLLAAAAEEELAEHLDSLAAAAAVLAVMFLELLFFQVTQL
jgi:hypothetical protein